MIHVQFGRRLVVVSRLLEQSRQPLSLHQIHRCFCDASNEQVHIRTVRRLVETLYLLGLVAIVGTRHEKRFSATPCSLYQHVKRRAAHGT